MWPFNTIRKAREEREECCKRLLSYLGEDLELGRTEYIWPNINQGTFNSNVHSNRLYLSRRAVSSTVDVRRKHGGFALHDYLTTETSQGRNKDNRIKIARLEATTLASQEAQERYQEEWDMGGWQHPSALSGPESEPDLNTTTKYVYARIVPKDKNR
ncbi:hypothetical protein ACFL0X_02095 [Nanoarchaeota archaeon]